MLRGGPAQNVCVHSYRIGLIVLNSSVGVLSCRFSLRCSPKRFFEVEFHLFTESNNTGVDRVTNDQQARVTHIVLRLDVPVWRELDAAYADNIASMEGYMTRLPCLQVVILETAVPGESDELADKLDILRIRGKLRQRTCREALSAAHEARRKSRFTGIQDAISPLWYLDKPSGARSRWYVDRPQAVLHSHRI